MLRKTSVSMMVLLVVAASLTGISSIHQYIQGQAPRAKVLSGEGEVGLIIMRDFSAGKTCFAKLVLQGVNSLGIKPGTDIGLIAPNEHFCTLFALSKIGKTGIGLEAQNVQVTALPPAIRGSLNLPANYPTFRHPLLN